LNLSFQQEQEKQQNKLRVENWFKQIKQMPQNLSVLAKNLQELQTFEDLTLPETWNEKVRLKLEEITSAIENKRKKIQEDLKDKRLQREKPLKELRSFVTEKKDMGFLSLEDLNPVLTKLNKLIHSASGAHRRLLTEAVELQYKWERFKKNLTRGSPARGSSAGGGGGSSSSRNANNKKSRKKKALAQAKAKKRREAEALKQYQSLLQKCLCGKNKNYEKCCGQVPIQTMKLREKPYPSEDHLKQKMRGCKLDLHPDKEVDDLVQLEGLVQQASEFVEETLQDKSEAFIITGIGKHGKNTPTLATAILRTFALLHQYKITYVTVRGLSRGIFRIERRDRHR